MKKGWIWIGIALVVVVLVGGAYYTRARPQAPPQRAVDPGLAVILAIRTLERDPGTRLTKQQIERILPFVKALKDIPPSDAEAAAVIARAVRDLLTPAQRAALEEARRRLRQRAQAPGARAGRAPGPDGEDGGGPPAGAGVVALSDDERAQMRMRAFQRMIRYLERRMQ
ncbi:MAG: hypothetical protein QN120_14305 [Armatimonadota bacterium]|nr:hypothetical protein [Armatimonadota bacterium]